MSKGSNRKKVMNKEMKLAMKANTNKNKPTKERTKEHDLYAQLDSIMNNQ